jgi:BirA family biotin operon repressor/biotin-[acetyl-CoA-carboxylase] ligase
VRRFAELDSTNRFLLDLARSGAPEGVVVVADHQTAGRGRLGRSWVSPPGASLLASVLLRPDLEPDRLHLVTLSVALAAAEALEAVAGFRPGLKWPNDLVVEDRKLAGVLGQADLPAVVVGIGLNLNWPPELLADIGPATAANQEVGHEVDGDAVLAALLERLAAGRGRWDELARAYRRSCTTLGRSVRVDLVDESFTGTAADVTGEGHLLVDVGACLRTVTAGDVVHVRASQAGDAATDRGWWPRSGPGPPPPPP